MNPQEIEQIKHTFEEAIKHDEKLDLNTEISKAQNNALIRRVMKEMVLSDVSGALGVINKQVLDAATKMAVSQDIINQVPVTEPLTRFYKRKRGSVWRIAEGPNLQSPGRFDTKDVSLGYEYGEDALFGQSYIEDCPFGVVEKELAEVGQLLEEQLTEDIIALYDAIAAANLAGGAVVNTTTSATLAYKDIVAGRRVLNKAGYGRMGGRKVLLVGPYEMEDLFNDEKFINNHYQASSLFDIQRGVHGSIFGYTIVETDLMADDAGGSNGNYAYMVNVDQAAVCTMRRNKLVQPYQEKMAEGVIATNRYGLGTLREDAVVRLDVVHA